MMSYYQPTSMNERLSKLVTRINGLAAFHSPRELAKLSLDREPTQSDVLTTGTYLNLMWRLKLINRQTYYKGKSPRYVYRRIPGVEIKLRNLK